MSLLLGIDLGTSYFKVGLFDATGEMKGLGRVAVDKVVPAPGHCELPIDVFWAALRRGLAEALSQTGATADKIAGISYSSQASTFVLLDRRSNPLTQLIMWMDTRGEPVPGEFAAFARTNAFRRTVGFGGLMGFSAVTKWRWFRLNAPGVWARTARIMTLSDYFTFVLTGERAGDASTAALLGLYDLGRQGWWPEALRQFDLGRAKLSIPLAPGAPSGRTINRAGDLLGVPAGIPFAVGALDHHAAAIGSGLGSLADLSISTGTVLAALGLVDVVKPIAGCFHGPHVDGRRFYRLAFDPDGAGQLEQYQRKHAGGRSIEELLALAADSAGAVQTPARPSSAADDAQVGAAVRAILERVSITHRRLVNEVLAGRAVKAIVSTGGGARSDFWQQINADILGVPVVTPSSAERACLGAAVFASVAAGIHPSLDDALRAMVHRGRVFEPDGKRG
jgi:sugar (pentulose or hexulose) kinase